MTYESIGALFSLLTARNPSWQQWKMPTAMQPMCLYSMQCALFSISLHKLIIDMYTGKFKWMSTFILLLLYASEKFNSTYIKRCIGCVFQSNAAVIRISHISAQSSLTSECWWLMLLMRALLLLLGCTGAPVKMHGMQYTSHALKLIDWHFNNCLWMKYWREFQKVKKKSPNIS